MEKIKVSENIILTAIVSLTILEVFAMHYGINGTMRAIIFTIIGSLAGLSMPSILKGGREK